MKLTQLFILMILITTFSCKNEPKKEIKPKEIPVKVDTLKTVKKEILEKEIIEKEWDSINYTNVVSFLTEYGKQNPETVVQITTKYGKIKLRLYKDTPLHRANFIFLTKVGYFDTTIFYRVLLDFVIQGGNSEQYAMMKYRKKYTEYKIPAEFRPNRKHKYGALASTRHWERNPEKVSSAYEFYIIQGRLGAHHLDNEHTVFGEVISGFSTIDKIANLETASDEWPYEDVFIKAEVLD